MRSILVLAPAALAACSAKTPGPTSVAPPPASVEAPRSSATPEAVVALPDRVGELSTLPQAPSVDMGDYDVAVLQAPATVPPVAVAAPAPPSVPTYDLGTSYAVEAYEPVPTVTAPQVLPRGSMAPIYDDPADEFAAAEPPAPSGAYDITARKAAYRGHETHASRAPGPRVRNDHTPAFGAKLAAAARERLNPAIRYDPAYRKIGFPWGDVPSSTGVCSDVVVRTYRMLGIDLQSLLNDDMRRAFSAYPSRKIYGLKKPDPNIDHRRVVNLEAFFERVGASVPVSSDPADYLPGDVVTWRLSGNEPHTGIVTAKKDPRSGNPLIVHNLGGGVVEEDILFLSPPVGHYRFAPDQQTRMAQLALRRR